MPVSRSTVLCASKISIRPMKRLWRPVSLAIAPTILVGLTLWTWPTSIRYFSVGSDPRVLFVRRAPRRPCPLAGVRQKCPRANSSDEDQDRNSRRSQALAALRRVVAANRPGRGPPAPLRCVRSAHRALGDSSPPRLRNPRGQFAQAGRDPIVKTCDRLPVDVLDRRNFHWPDRARSPARCASACAARAGGQTKSHYQCGCAPPVRPMRWM